MTLTKTYVRKVIDTYIQAWIEQDPELITTIFTQDATYHERVLESPISTLEGIRDYWQTKVVESQKNINCQLLSLYVDGDTAIAEWEVYFDDLPRNTRRQMREVAILVFEGRLIASLREYWSSKPTGEIACVERMASSM